VPIDRNRIRSNVTLELDDNSISITEFGKAVQNFLGLVRDVSEVTAPAKDSSAWDVEIYEGSAGLGVRPVAGVYSFDEVSRISSTVVDGLRQIAAGIKPPLFSDKAVERSRVLSALVNRQREPLTVRVWAGRDDVVPLSKEVADKAEHLLAPVYQDEGSVEGVLQRLDGHTKRELVIFDSVSDRGIKCYVDDTLMRNAGRFWYKRVEVLGTVRYRQDGQPVSVHAKNIIPFPEADEIPTIEEVRELLRGA
jgi:hypothetical protein